MSIPRLLVLSFLLSVAAAPLAAQSTSDNQLTVPPHRTLPGLRIGPLQDFHLQGSAPAPETSQIIRAPGGYGKPFRSDRSEVVCYSIRSYRVTRDNPESDSTRPSGYSTCQPSDRFQVKDAEEPQQILVR